MSPTCSALWNGKNIPSARTRKHVIIKSMKRTPEIIEGQEAFVNFDSLVGSVLSVPRSVIEEREAEYKKKAALNPRKRGPKKKNASLEGESV